ncbi:MAG: hypothetical protein WCK37_02800 [Candidatus Falkowbacteria bacterium]
MPSEIKKTVSTATPTANKIVGPIKLFVSTYEIFKNNVIGFSLNTIYRIVALLPIFVIAFLYALVFSVFAIDNILLLLLFGALYLAAIIFSVYLMIRFDVQLLLMLKKTSGQFWDIFKVGRKYFWSYALLLVSLVFVIFLGSLLFILPGLVLAVFASLILCVAVSEDLGYAAAIKRGLSLASKNFFGIAWRLILLAVGFFVVYFVVRILFSFFPDYGILLMIHKLLSSLVFYVGYTFSMIYIYLIYKSLADKK